MSEFTASTFVKTDGYFGVGQRPYFSENRECANFCFISSANGNVSFRIRTLAGTVAATSSNFDLEDNKWHYFVGTFNGDTIALYIDGELNIQQTLAPAFNGTFIDLENGITTGADRGVILSYGPMLHDDTEYWPVFYEPEN